MSAEKTPCISAIDTTNFARQIVLDFEFAPVPKQRQRRGLRNEIIEVGAVKLDYHGNVMGEFSQFVQTEFTEGVAFPVCELTGISAVDTAMADPLYVVIKRLSDWIGRYSAQIVCWSGADRRQLLTECQAKHIDLSAFLTDWADLQAFYTSIMDVGSHGRVSLSDAATWFGIEFDESTGHAHSALADARVTAKLLKQAMNGDYHVSPRAQEVRQRWGMGERAQTRLSSKCPELGDLLLKLKAEGRQRVPIGRKQKEWLREGFQNQHQRTVLEMLFKDTLMPAETKQVKRMDIEMASIVEERLANMIRWMGRHRPVTLCALSFTMRRTGCQRRTVPTRFWATASSRLSSSSTRGIWRRRAI